MAYRLCEICNKQVNHINPGLKCDSFCTRYHVECLNIAADVINVFESDGVSWSCRICPQASPPGDSSDTLEGIRAELK